MPETRGHETWIAARLIWVNVYGMWSRADEIAIGYWV
jgi:hypothetical protein